MRALRVQSFAVPCSAVPCRCLRFRIYPEACKYISPPIYLSTFPRIHRPIHPPIPVYLHPSITCGLVMCTARDGPIIRHLSRSASPFLLPFPIPTHASAYAHRYRGICKKRKMYTERRIYRETDTEGHACVYVFVRVYCVCLCGSVRLTVLTVLAV